VSNIIDLYKDSEELLKKAINGLIGNGVGLEFMEFFKLNRSFDDVLEMMTNPNRNVVIPSRSDEKYALCASISYLLWNGKSDDDDKQRVDGLFRIIEKLPSDFAALVVKNAMQGNKRVTPMQACQLLMLNSNYRTYFAKYAADANKKYSI